jgi:hypothetical protein
MSGARIPEKRQHATPIYIDRLEKGGVAHALRRVGLTTTTTDDIKYEESKLQTLLFDFPNTLPVTEIDPGFGPLAAVCIELPTPSGYIDNLFVTEAGDLAIAECKLWRNPQARRQVVAQIIDYAHNLTSWSYDDLDTAIRRAQLPSGGKVDRSLFDHVVQVTSLDEPQFIDAVSRNLRLGRVMLMVVGDGIREGVETLANFLQLHAGIHFTLALVEMPVYQLPSGGFVLQPRVLAKTLNIERGIVRIAADQVRVDPISIAQAPSGTPFGTAGVTQDRLMEALRQTTPNAVSALEKFLDMAGEEGVFLESATKSLMLKWHGADGKDYTLGGIDGNGKFITNSVPWVPNGMGRIDAAHEYLSGLAKLVSGIVRKTPDPANWYVAKSGTATPDAIELLDRPSEFLTIIRSYIGKLRSAIESQC